jgi:hypothetical protein
MIRHRPAPRQAPGFRRGDLDMAHDALRTILPIAGWPEDPSATLRRQPG